MTSSCRVMALLWRMQAHQTIMGATLLLNNNDGWADLMFLDDKNSEVVAGWNWTDNDTRDTPNPPDITLGSGTQSGDYGDFNGDGWPDAIGFDDNDNIMIYMNLATPTN